ncbi:hypothetical protein PILCRDRAFT_784274 [Piloderma croceum F 1598]|uniref:Fungal N-terminal domain-containing protein n=1 Tax=Piloderma croceum (strain F 1598) TaxID=765440 RepID=A0A0C3FY13_PILCF|nr:hypothetical protein PILCRDRAFT_784274 [Piloderma croceum F 1598]
MVDNATDLIDQITPFLLDRNHSPNNLRDMALELESLHQTLTLIKLTIQKYNKTPLGQSLADFIAPEVNRCFAALQGLLGSTDDIRLCLSSTSIGHLWRLVWRVMLRDEFASARKKLSISRQSFQALLFTLHSRKCLGLFQIADANQNHQNQTRLAGRGDKARNGLTDEERREDDAQSVNEELASPASRTNRNVASESYTITKQQEQNDDGTQFFRRIRVICMDDGISPPRSKGLGQNQIGINDVLGHLLCGTQHVADADEQLEAALKSFKMIENWYEARSAPVDAAVAVAMRGARTMGRDYVEAVESSVKVAGHGVAFAADVVILCEHLNQGRDSGIRSFIDEMRMIARLAQSETKTTHGRFGAIRRKLYQLTIEIPAQQQDIKGGQDNHHTQRDLICASKLLRKAFDDIGHLVDGVAKFAHWWSEAESVISTLEKQMFVDRRRISLLQLDKARKGWEAVHDRYEVYSRVVSAMQ